MLFTWQQIHSPFKNMMSKLHAQQHPQLFGADGCWSFDYTSKHLHTDMSTNEHSQLILLYIIADFHSWL